MGETSLGTVTQTRGGFTGFWTVAEYGQQAQLSAAGIPQITVSHGNATAGGAYQVALSDYVILVRGQTQLFSQAHRFSKRQREKSLITRPWAGQKCMRQSLRPEST